MLSPDLQEQVKKAIKILQKDGIVAFPTDTVYGLGANALSEKAVEKIYRAKERPLNLALPVLLAEASQMEKLAHSIPPLAWKLAERFFPGALTLVLPRAPALPPLVAGGGDTIALRVPAHPVPLALIRGLGAPITGTSANLSGKPSPLTAEEVRRQLGGKVDFIIDGGKSPGGIESTVVDLTSPGPVILREGAISRKELEEACGRKLLLAKGEKDAHRRRL